MKGSALAERLGAILGNGFNDESVAVLNKRLAGARPASRLAALQLAEQACLDAPVNELDRVVLARVAVVLLPASAPIVEGLLANANPPNRVAELQFSMFVALSDIQEFAPGDVRSRMLAATAGFLQAVMTNEAQAAWMAGDLLGDHWPRATRRCGAK